MAHARNRKRQIPIPDSTIISMEQRLELPEPNKHHWERRSSVLHNNCLKEEFRSNALLVLAHCTLYYPHTVCGLYRVTVKELISEAIAQPEQEMEAEDSEMKVMNFYLSHKLYNMTH